ncbi:hypothetical protein T484DRAFT_1909500 [Baffinella frigidus]|nr:hypothetical protein T484DRAFT_1909500 [Cryptophyta sp. CCMP2293]
MKVSGEANGGDPLATDQQQFTMKVGGEANGGDALGSEEFSIINMHLIHDADNVHAYTPPPTQYSLRRQAMLREVVRLSGAKSSEGAIFAGDFNMRGDLRSACEALAPRIEVRSSKEVFCDLSEEEFWPLTRRFDCELGRANARWESDYLNGEGWDEDAWETGPCQDGEAMQLLECGHNGQDWSKGPYASACRWSPTYLYLEGVSTEPGKSATGRYNAKRFPSWCDRVLGTPALWALLGVTGPADADAAIAAGRFRYGKKLPPHSDHAMVFFEAHLQR